MNLFANEINIPRYHQHRIVKGKAANRAVNLKFKISELRCRSHERESWHPCMTTYRLIICIGILDTIIKHRAQVGKQSRVTKQDIYIYVVGIIACSQQRL